MARGAGDNRILELNEKNIELERKILDLEENLREKDELIRAKAQAVTLMSADFSAKGKSTLDQVRHYHAKWSLKISLEGKIACNLKNWAERNSLQVSLPEF